MDPATARPASREGIESRARFVEEWFAALLKGYPGSSARLMAGDPDPFRNPAGHQLRHNLVAIVDALIDGAPPPTAALDGVVRLRALQGFTASEAVSFLLPLGPILGRDRPGHDFGERIDRFMLASFDLYVACREQMWTIRANEASRRTWIVERIESARSIHPEPGT